MKLINCYLYFDFQSFIIIKVKDSLDNNFLYYPLLIIKFFFMEDVVVYLIIIITNSKFIIDYFLLNDKLNLFIILLAVFKLYY